MKTSSCYIIAWLLLCAVANAQEARLEWTPDQIRRHISYYIPQRLELSPARPDGVTKVPDGLKNPLFAVVKLGPRGSQTSFALLLDEPDGTPARLWVDANGNGDFTDDRPINWNAHRGKGGNSAYSNWGGGAIVEVTYGAEKRRLGLNIYRFDKTDPHRATFKNVIFCYPAFGFLGDVTLGDTKYSAALVDDKCTGDFRGADNADPSGVSLLLDLNGDGKFDIKSERFDIRRPFNVGGTNYEVTGLTAGGSFTITKSDKTVAERPKAPQSGVLPAAFDQTTTTGQAVHFPADYGDKLVMLDFWATWCGPCRRELPGVVRAYDEFHARGFEVLGVSLDKAGSQAKLAAFTRDNHMPWPQVCDGKSWQSPIVSAYGVRGIPAAFLVDGRTGKIVAMGQEVRGDKLRGTIERCLSTLGAAR